MQYSRLPFELKLPSPTNTTQTAQPFSFEISSLLEHLRKIKTYTLASGSATRSVGAAGRDMVHVKNYNTNKLATIDNT